MSNRSKTHAQPAPVAFWFLAEVETDPPRWDTTFRSGFVETDAGSISLGSEASHLRVKNANDRPAVTRLAARNGHLQECSRCGLGLLDPRASKASRAAVHEHGLRLERAPIRPQPFGPRFALEPADQPEYLHSCSALAVGLQADGDAGTAASCMF